MSRKLEPASPGGMLAKAFPGPLVMRGDRLAKEIGARARRIGELLAGRRSVTADTALRPCRLFGRSDGWRLLLRADYHTDVAKPGLARSPVKVGP